MLGFNVVGLLEVVGLFFFGLGVFSCLVYWWLAPLSFFFLMFYFSLGTSILCCLVSPNMVFLDVLSPLLLVSFWSISMLVLLHSFLLLLFLLFGGLIFPVVFYSIRWLVFLVLSYHNILTFEVFQLGYLLTVIISICCHGGL